VCALLDAELTLIPVSAGLLPAKHALLQEIPIHYETLGRVGGGSL
jgi:hypothetical protein